MVETNHKRPDHVERNQHYEFRLNVADWGFGETMNLCMGTSRVAESYSMSMVATEVAILALHIALSFALVIVVIYAAQEKQAANTSYWSVSYCILGTE